MSEHRLFLKEIRQPTLIGYQLPVRTHVALKIYDVLGEEVAVLVDEIQEAGYRSVTWNASINPSGVYFYRLQSGSFEATKKLLLLR
jgi:type IX secretion system substrate protein